MSAPTHTPSAEVTPPPKAPLRLPLLGVLALLGAAACGTFHLTEGGFWLALGGAADAVNPFGGIWGPLLQLAETLVRETLASDFSLVEVGRDLVKEATAPLTFLTQLGWFTVVGALASAAWLAVAAVGLFGSQRWGARLLMLHAWVQFVGLAAGLTIFAWFNGGRALAALEAMQRASLEPEVLQVFGLIVVLRLAVNVPMALLWAFFVQALLGGKRLREFFGRA